MSYTLPKEIVRRETLSRTVLPGLTNLTHTSELEDLRDKFCVYITGSLARLEIDENSDLDLFVVDHVTPEDPLSFIETSRVIATLEAIRKASLFRERRYSRGGYFLRPLPFSSMIREIGDPQEDARNLFTARMLLLINSLPMINRPVYDDLRSRSIDAYWSTVDSGGQLRMVPHDKPHKPLMFMNDLRRWWLSVALNFERNHSHRAVSEKARARSEGGLEDPLDDPVVERRIANLKLRHARSLAVFTVLATLLAAQRSDGVTRADFDEALSLTPVQRLTAIREKSPDVQDTIDRILDMYASYLEFLSGNKTDLALRVQKDQEYKPMKQQSYRFHREICELLERLGKGSLLYDYMVV